MLKFFPKFTKRTGLAQAGAAALAAALASIAITASATLAASITTYATKAAPYLGADLLVGIDSTISSGVSSRNFSLTNLAAFFLASPTTTGTTTVGAKLSMGAATTLASSATIALDPTLNSYYKVTLTQNVAFASLTTGTAGQVFFLEVDENGTGGFTATGNTGWTLPALGSTAAAARNVYICFMPTSASVVCK